MYSKLTYFDAWCCEKKHQRYKKVLAQSLQHLWEEKTGELSRQICSRMLHSTMSDYEGTKDPETVEMCGRIYSEEKVQRQIGLSCKVSTACHVGKCLLKVGHILFWSRGADQAAGKVQFFATEAAGHEVLVYEVLHPLKSETTFSLRLSPTQVKAGVLVRDLRDVRLPAWWAWDNGSWLCLL